MNAKNKINALFDEGFILSRVLKLVIFFCNVGSMISISNLTVGKKSVTSFVTYN